MRTQACPRGKTTKGSTASSTAASTKMMSLERVMRASPSSTIGHALTQQALWPQGQHQDEHGKGEDVLVVAAQHPTRQVADVAGAHGFDDAQRHPSHHGAGQVADATEHRRREGLEA